MLDDLAYEVALSNAEMYGIYPPSDEDTDEDIEEGNSDEGIWGCHEPYNSDKHDGHTITGTPHFEKI
jgi:hypothetical protein